MYYDRSRYGDDQTSILDSLLDEIQEQDVFEESIGHKKVSDKVNLDKNRKGDVMTLHAAIELGPNGVLITSDKALRIVAQRHSVQVMRPSTFIKKLACSDKDLDQ
jgi:predicted nucleic acid-binding protein